MTATTNDSVDLERRRFLTYASGVVGAAGIAALVTPFLEAWNPGAKTKVAGGPIEIDISKIEEGQMVTAEWRKKPAWVLRRTKKQIAELPKNNGNLKDPESKEPQQPPNLANFDPVNRAVKADYLVLIGICTHLGCVPEYRPQVGDPDLGASWPGGFFCPCHGSRYDLAGRVMYGSPAPLNLPVPAYYFKGESIVRVGELQNGADLNWSPAVW